MLKTRGIVFRSVKYGETSVIADIYTEERGLHSFIAGGVRAPKSRMAYGLFQPMSVVELVSYFKDDGKALHRLKEVRACVPFSAIPFDLKRGAVALFMAEVCRKSIREEGGNRELFDYLLENLLWLDETQHPIANLHLHFLAGLSAFLGFQPQQEHEGAAYFDLKEGAYLTYPPVHPHFLNETQTQQWQLLTELPVNNCHELPIARAERKALLQQLLRFYQFHVPDFGEVNTPGILELVMEG